MAKSAVTLVYAGPTLDAATIEKLLPGAQVRPPVQRGDLYKDRALGSSVFVIFDGVFFQNNAISPREIIDVIDDGGMLVGASSMGALRAAECWPAGMRGIGSIYRMFRFGYLDSDDEVAVVFDPENAAPPSIPLINVRYAVSKVHAGGNLSCEEGRAIVNAAKNLFYPERAWGSILDVANLQGKADYLIPLLSGFDLKATDACRALKLLQSENIIELKVDSTPGKGIKTFYTSALTREKPHDTLAGEPVLDIKDQLLQWLFASGRYTKYASPILHSVFKRVSESTDIAEIQQVREMLAQFTMRHQLYTSKDVELWYHRWAQKEEILLQSMSAKLATRHLLKCYVEDASELKERIWAEMGVSGELDAEILRWRAIQLAAKEAAGENLVPGKLQYYQAEQQMAFDHGFQNWTELEDCLWEIEAVKQMIMDYRPLLATAKLVREFWFRGHQT